MQDKVKASDLVPKPSLFETAAKTVSYRARAEAQVIFWMFGFHYLCVFLCEGENVRGRVSVCMYMCVRYEKGNERASSLVDALSLLFFSAFRLSWTPIQRVSS